MSDTNAPYSPAKPSDADEQPSYATEAISGESGYGAGETGSINRGSESSGVTSDSGDNNGSKYSAPLPDGTAQTNAADLDNAEAAGDMLANSGDGARYSEANVTAGELTNSDRGYAAGFAGGSGADEARGFRTSSDPEYGERDMGYGDDK